MTDKPRAKCPVCGKAATRKISGGAGLVFKGSGFYITDYGKDGKGPREGGVARSRPRESKPERQAEGGQPKPAAKPSPKPKAEAKPAKKAASE